MTAEIGLISPPFGISVYTVRSSLSGLDGTQDSVTIQDIFRGSYMYMACMFLALFLMILFPPIVTMLPSLM